MFRRASYSIGLLSALLGLSVMVDTVMADNIPPDGPCPNGTAPGVETEACLSPAMVCASQSTSAQCLGSGYFEEVKSDFPKACVASAGNMCNSELMQCNRPTTCVWGVDDNKCKTSPATNNEPWTSANKRVVKAC